MDKEIEKLTKITTIGQNKVTISRLAKQIQQLEKENEVIQKEIEGM